MPVSPSIVRQVLLHTEPVWPEYVRDEGPRLSSSYLIGDLTAESQTSILEPRELKLAVPLVAKKKQAEDVSREVTLGKVTCADKRIRSITEPIFRWPRESNLTFRF